MSPRSRGRKPKRPRKAAARRPATPRADAEQAGSPPRITAAAPTVVAPAIPAHSGRVGMSISTLNCNIVHDLEPQGLGMSYWFDTGNWTQPATVTVTFTGRLAGDVNGDGNSTFTEVETVDLVPPRAGRVTVTGRAVGVAAGTWTVRAQATVRNLGSAAPGQRSAATEWALPEASSAGVTAFAPVMRVRAPGARLGAWPGLVLTGVLVALVTQAMIAARLHLAWLTLSVVSVTASLVGLICSKVYYKLLHRSETGGLLVAGLGIQGFVLGLLATLAVGVPLTGLPLLRALDATVPGLLFAMSIGRFGCFFGGCCAGRPTNGRGLWSSDRRVGIRRVPVQLFESSVAFLTGVTTLLLDLLATPTPSGVVFTGGLAAYTLGRQLLFPLRDIRRQTRLGRPLMISATAVILAADVVIAVLS